MMMEGEVRECHAVVTSILTCIILLVIFFLLKSKVILIVPVNTLISPVCTKEQWYPSSMVDFNPLNAKLNPICRLLALLGAHLIFHVSGLRVKLGSKVQSLM
jgi:hypothetical protein